MADPPGYPLSFGLGDPVRMRFPLTVLVVPRVPMATVSRLCITRGREGTLRSSLESAGQLAGGAQPVCVGSS